jgi:hypothetical protein
MEVPGWLEPSTSLDRSDEVPLGLEDSPALVLDSRFGGFSAVREDSGFMPEGFWFCSAEGGVGKWPSDAGEFVARTGGGFWGVDAWSRAFLRLWEVKRTEFSKDDTTMQLPCGILVKLVTLKYLVSKVPRDLEEGKRPCVHGPKSKVVDWPSLMGREILAKHALPRCMRAVKQASSEW